MATRQYTSGNLQRKSDFCVTYIPAKSGKIITTIHSKTAVLHGSKLHDICSTTLSDLHISYGRLKVTDTGGQYFVLKARVDAVVKAANPKAVAESLQSLRNMLITNRKRIVSEGADCISPGTRPSSC